MVDVLTEEAPAGRRALAVLILVNKESARGGTMGIGGTNGAREEWK